VLGLASRNNANEVTLVDVLEQSQVLQEYLEQNGKASLWDQIDYNYLEILIMQEARAYMRKHDLSDSGGNHGRFLATDGSVKIKLFNDKRIEYNRATSYVRNLKEREFRATLDFKIKDLIAATGEAAVIVTETAYSEILAKPLGGASYTFSGGYQDISGGERALASAQFVTLPEL